MITAINQKENMKGIKRIGNFLNRPCTVYVGCPMTGFDKEHMVQIARYACHILEIHGLKPWSPVLAEKISGKGHLENNKVDLEWKWPMDKEALDKCFVFINLRADEKSFGCEDEYGRHRYSEWQPVVRISPKHAAGYISIANYQTDLIVHDIETAAIVIANRWGSWHSRIWWKLGVVCRSGPKWFLRQLWRFFQ